MSQPASAPMRSPESTAPHVNEDAPVNRLEASPTPAPIRARHVQGPGDAEAICARIEATMEALLQLIEAESELLRSGRAVAAAALEPAKNDYARAYLGELDLLRTVGADIEAHVPGSVERLRRRHEEFVSVLQIDLAALATAQAASDPLAPKPGRSRPAGPLPRAGILAPRSAV